MVTTAWIAERADDLEWIDEHRQRLADLGWFMKSLKEPIARRANDEDHCIRTFRYSMAMPVVSCSRFMFEWNGPTEKLPACHILSSGLFYASQLTRNKPTASANPFLNLRCEGTNLRSGTVQ